MPKFDNLIRYESVRSGAGKEALENKIAEFKKWKEEVSPEEFEEIILRFKSFRDGRSNDSAGYRFYDKWTKNDFNNVLQNVNSK